jgi:hypothetical protein
MLKATKRTQVAAALVGLLFMSCLGWANGSDFPSHNHLIGFWFVEGQPDPASGVDPFVNVATISAGSSSAQHGFITNIDASGGVGVGGWTWAGGSNYVITFSGFLGPATRFVVRATVTASPDAFHGPFRTDVQDLAGNILFSFEGTVSAARQAVEPY